MTRVMIRVDAELSDEVTSAFPQLTTRRHRVQTTLTGEVAGNEELQRMLDLLSSLGIAVIEVVTIPAD